MSLKYERYLLLEDDVRVARVMELGIESMSLKYESMSLKYEPFSKPLHVSVK